MGNKRKLSSPVESTCKHSRTDSATDRTSNLYLNGNTIPLSESQPAIVHQNSSSTSGDINHALDVTPNPSPRCRSERLLDTPISDSQTDTVEEQITTPSASKGDELPYHSDHESVARSKIQTDDEVVSDFTGTGKAESFIKVPLQGEYNNAEREVISSALANISCASLGIQGILDLLNAILRTSLALDTPSLSSILEDCITYNYDFGTAYGRLRPVWKTYYPSTNRDELCRDEEEDPKKRPEALEGSTSGGVNHIMEVTPHLSPRRHPEGPEPLLDTSILDSQTATGKEQPASPSVNKGDKCLNYDDYESVVRSRIETGKEVISAFTETGKVESSIEVPLQRKFTGHNFRPLNNPQREVISSALTNIPCISLGIQGILDLLNAILQTSHTLETPSVSSLLEDCISQNYDFGTAYGRLRRVWKFTYHGTMQDELRRCEEKDQETRRDALVGNQIVNPQLPPRRVWDLYSNRVMPYWIAGQLPESISHAWMDEKDRIDVWTPINGKEWPVPIPKDADLNLIRIEMLNLGVEYAWLDVLCLRQVGGLREDLRMEEWEIDVPTIGYVYLNRRWKPVMIYLSGLGRPLSLKDGDMDSERSWFRRAWTVQEIGEQRIIAGDTPDGPMHAKPINKDGNYETAILTRFHMQWESFKRLNRGIFSTLADMQKRVSTNPVDKIAGLAFPLSPNTIPVYHESEPLEDAWTALVNTMSPWIRVGFLFLYPEAGRVGSKKWRPAWEQVSTEPLPVDAPWLGTVRRNDEKDEDWYEGYCIEKGLVCGFNVGLAEGGDRHGSLVVKDADGREHIFKIIATHQHPIPEDSYTLLGNDLRASKYWAVGRRLPEQRFKKVSVFALNDSKEADRLVDLGIRSRNILV